MDGHDRKNIKKNRYSDLLSIGSFLTQLHADADIVCIHFHAVIISNMRFASKMRYIFKIRRRFDIGITSRTITTSTTKAATAFAAATTQIPFSFRMTAIKIRFSSAPPET